MMKIEVAGIVVKLDVPNRYFRDDIYKFRCENSWCEDVQILVSYDDFPRFPDFKDNTPPIHHVHAFNNANYYLFSADDFVNYIKYDDQHKFFTINLSEVIEVSKENEIEAVNSAMRRIFIMMLAVRGIVSLHSSTVGLFGEAICFSAGSGTGKTTHTELWKKHINNTEILNGDKGYLSINDETPCFHSAPWCGTSGQLINKKAPIKAIMFLKQAKQNNIEKLSIPDSFMQLLTGCFLPAWDKQLYLKAIDVIESLAYVTDCYQLSCLPNEEAVRIAYHGIYQN